MSDHWLEQLILEQYLIRHDRFYYGYPSKEDVVDQYDVGIPPNYTASDLEHAASMAMNRLPGLLLHPIWYYEIGAVDFWGYVGGIDTLVSLPLSMIECRDYERTTG